MMHPIFQTVGQCRALAKYMDAIDSDARPKFSGWQSNARGKFTHALFTDLLTGSTFAVRNGGNVTEALARSRGKFEEAKQ